MLALHFFLSALPAIVLYSTTELSQNVIVGPCNCTHVPSLNLSATTCSDAIFNAVNSEPQVDVSMQFCLFEYHIFGILLRRVMNLVSDLLFKTSSAWLASTKQLICSWWPLGWGASVGTSSPAPAYCLLRSYVGFFSAIYEHAARVYQVLKLSIQNFN